MAVLVVSGHGQYFAYDVCSIVGCICRGQLHFIVATVDILRWSRGRWRYEAAVVDGISLELQSTFFIGDAGIS